MDDDDSIRWDFPIYPVPYPAHDIIAQLIAHEQRWVCVDDSRICLFLQKDDAEHIRDYSFYK